MFGLRKLKTWRVADFDWSHVRFTEVFNLYFFLLPVSFVLFLLCVRSILSEPRKTWSFLKTKGLLQLIEGASDLCVKNDRRGFISKKALTWIKKEAANQTVRVLSDPFFYLRFTCTLENSLLRSRTEKVSWVIKYYVGDPAQTFHVSYTIANVLRRAHN